MAQGLNQRADDSLASNEGVEICKISSWYGNEVDSMQGFICTSENLKFLDKKYT